MTELLQGIMIGLVGMPVVMNAHCIMISSVGGGLPRHFPCLKLS